MIVEQLIIEDAATGGSLLQIEQYNNTTVLSVPQENDVLIINDLSYRVDSVEWNYDTSAVLVRGERF